MTVERQHALLSASGAHRWMHCTPSARLEREFEDIGGIAAAEGTAAHALAEHKLCHALGLQSLKSVSLYDSDEMDVHTDAYVAFVLETIAQVKLSCPDPLVLIEQKLDLSQYVPSGFGTGDCLIVADGVLHVIDFKYGQGLIVKSEDNPQMLLYGLGALSMFDHLYDIREVSMTIFQPRRENVSTSVVSKEDLLQWAERVLKPTASLAFEGGGEYSCGSWCQFCKAAVKCRARADEKMKLAAFEFVLPPLLSDEEVSEVLLSIGDLTTWANEITAYATDAAVNHGKQWPGFKVVEGRSNRKYVNEEAVAEAAQTSGHHDIYRQTLLTVSELEKKLGKAKFQEVLGGLIIQPPGKPTLVPLSDKRPPMNTSNAKIDFTEE